MGSPFSSYRNSPEVASTVSAGSRAVRSAHSSSSGQWTGSMASGSGGGEGEEAAHEGTHLYLPVRLSRMIVPIRYSTAEDEVLCLDRQRRGGAILIFDSPKTTHLL